ncbi:MAG: RodZ domain-containing protein [Rhodospirillaceae bacterium]
MGDLKRRFLTLISGRGGLAARGGGPGGSEAGDPRHAPGIGSVLRAARIEAGLELRDVAAMLKIRYPFMLAIEEEHYHELPGTAYAMGFVRTYADYLGLDTDGVVRRFKDEVAGKADHQNLYFPTPVPEGKIPGGTILLVSVVMACLIYGGWYVLSATDRSMVDVVPSLPHRLVSLLDVFSNSGGSVPTAPVGSSDAVASPEAVTSTAEPVSSAAGSVPLPVTLAAGSDPLPVLPGGVIIGGVGQGAGQLGDPRSGDPAPSVSVVVADNGAGESGDEIPLVSGPADELVGGLRSLIPMAPRSKPVRGSVQTPTPTPTPTPTSSPAPAPAPTSTPTSTPAPAANDVGAALAVTDAGSPPGRVYGGQNRESRVLIKAIEDAWVQVRDREGDPVFTRVMRPGDVYRVPGRAGMRLRTGNAGALVAIVDGAKPQPLGQSGQVLRDTLIDAAALRHGSGSGNR